MEDPRTLIVCLDGTGRQFDDHNSNVVLLHSMLHKGDPDRQIVYYQPGIGTYSSMDSHPVQESSFLERMNPRNNRYLDLALATCLKEHIIGAYQFLVDHYTSGDNICIFGYSRGAYTARALAGMIAKVGLAVSCNGQIIEDAYEIYRKDDEEGWIESGEFKNAYSMDVTIKFVGVWDTVSSVGIIPHHLPLTCDNPHIETFRHALSLDERRASFQPLLYHYGSDYLRRRRRENGREWHRINLEDQYRDNDRPPTDLSEVWFSGSHADVGGGAMENGEMYGLSYISLRWMIRQCYLAETGINFKYHKLQAIGLDPELLEPDVLPRMREVPLTIEDLRAAVSRRQPELYEDDDSIVNAMVAENFRDLADALSPIHDALKTQRAWWLLEVTRGWHNENGHFVPHNGRGRVVEDQHDGMLVHRSVKLRIDAGRLWNHIEQANNEGLGLERYRPAVQFDVEPIWVD